MGDHFIIKCRKCDKVITQCRCIAKDKTVRYGDCGCTPKEEERSRRRTLSKPIALEAMVVLSDPHATLEQYRAAMRRIYELAKEAQ